MKQPIICGIYKITSPTKRIYIGQSANCRRRYLDYKRGRSGVQRMLHNSILKYGWDAHSFQIIYQCPRKELNYWEKYYIKLLNSFNTGQGMNLTDGGGAKSKISDETRKKISAGNRGKKLTEETKQKIREANLGNKYGIGKRSEESKQNMRGIKRTEESKIRMSKARIGMKLSQETKEKIKIKQTGRILSKETRIKMSNNKRGEKNHFYRKKHSQETKKEISKKLKIIKNLPEQILKNSQSHIGLQVGEKNGMSKIVLNTITGIYYQCAREAEESTGSKISHFSCKLLKTRKNNTPFIYA